MTGDKALAVERRMLEAVRKYKQRLAAAERGLQAELEIYNAEMRLLAARNLGGGTAPCFSTEARRSAADK